MAVGRQTRARGNMRHCLIGQSGDGVRQTEKNSLGVGDACKCNKGNRVSMAYRNDSWHVVRNKRGKGGGERQSQSKIALCGELKKVCGR